MSSSSEQGEGTPTPKVTPPTLTGEQKEALAAIRKGAEFDNKIITGCVLAPLVLIGACLTLPSMCPDPGGRNCGGPYLAWDTAEERREALERRAQSAIGVERLVVEQELAEARRLERTAEAAWRACTDR